MTPPLAALRADAKLAQKYSWWRRWDSNPRFPRYERGEDDLTPPLRNK